jgi:hypothetical protein
MNNKTVFFVILLIFVFPGLSVFSQTEQAYYLSEFGNDNNDGRTEQTAFRTFEKARERVSFGSLKKIIVIGTITGNHILKDSPGNTEILITGKSSNSNSAVFSGDKESPVFYINCSAKIRFENVTITNGGGDKGGGLLISYLPGKPSVTLGAGTQVVNNTVVPDAFTVGVARGGGVCVTGTDAALIVDGALIDGNISPDGAGGGIAVYDGGKCSMKNGTISNNSTKTGGVECREGSFTMSGGVIENNHAYAGGGIFGITGGGISVAIEPLTFSGGVYVEQRNKKLFIQKGGKIFGNKAGEEGTENIFVKK